jgi:Uncharacterized conserved protein (DUF2190)
MRGSGIIISTMATGATNTYDLPYPVLSDPVNVHEDIQSLAERLEDILSNVGVPFISLEVRNTTGATIAKGTPVRISGYTTKPLIAKCDSDDLTTFPVVGITQAAISNNANGVIIVSGVFEDINTSSYTAGDILYVANGGGLTKTIPAGGSGAVAVVAKSNASTGIIIVGQPKGNGTWGALKNGLA